MTFDEIKIKLDAGYSIKKRFWPLNYFWFKYHGKIYEFTNLNKDSFSVPEYGIREICAGKIPSNNLDKDWMWGKKIENYSYLKNLLVGIEA